MTPRRLALVVALLTWLVAAPSAAAHDETGNIAVAPATAAGPTSLDVAVDVTYTNDGHAAADATVTVVAEGPGGASVGPIPMAPVGPAGRYAATLEFPTAGQWLLRFSSLTPVGSVEVAHEVGAGGPARTAVTQETAPPTSAPTPAPTSAPAATSAPSTTEAEPAATAGAAGTLAAPAGDDGGGGSGALVAALVVLGVAVVAGAGAYAWRRRAASS